LERESVRRLPHLLTMRRLIPDTATKLLAIGVIFALISAGSYLILSRDRAGDVEAIENSLTATTVIPTTTTGPGTAVTTPSQPDSRITPNPISRLVDLVPNPDPAPVRLIIESMGVDAPVAPYGVNRRTGQMDVPRNVTDVAWYRYGPTPGQPGSSVLAAHVDLTDQGRGVFYGLRNLNPGQLVTVEYEDGTTSTFEVAARATYLKSELPLDKIFSSTGSPVLTLVTCGGAFSPSARHYDSNVVVYAIPVPAPDSQTLHPEGSTAPN
jgi:sortase (surface protein transpeptidase)